MEPIFSRQEQAVVYLFSRYWEKMKEFKGKTILRIHTHFPDFILLDQKKRPEAIEFEYALSDFASHLQTRKDLKKLKRILIDTGEEGGRGRFVLYVVFWCEDHDRSDIRARIKEAGIEPRFVCLKDGFSPIVSSRRRTDRLHAFWMFPRVRRVPEAYGREELERAVKRLANRKLIRILKINRDLYRKIGFELSGSSFIECDHWEKIHFFTTSTRFSVDRIPSALFVKPNGCDYFIGYFAISRAFEIEAPGKLIEDLFKRFYFFPYEKTQHFESKCFVCNFVPLSFRDGRALYRGLVRKKYNLGVRGAIEIGKTDIDSIVKPRLLA